MLWDMSCQGRYERWHRKSNIEKKLRLVVKYLRGMWSEFHVMYLYFSMVEIIVTST